MGNTARRNGYPCVISWTLGLANRRDGRSFVRRRGQPSATARQGCGRGWAAHLSRPPARGARVHARASLRAAAVAGAARRIHHVCQVLLGSEGLRHDEHKSAVLTCAPGPLYSLRRSEHPCLSAPDTGGTLGQELRNREESDGGEGGWNEARSNWEESDEGGRG